MNFLSIFSYTVKQFEFLFSKISCLEWAKKGIVSIYFCMSCTSPAMQEVLSDLKKRFLPEKDINLQFKKALQETYRSDYGKIIKFLEKHPDWMSKIDPVVQVVYLNELIDKKDGAKIKQFARIGLSPNLSDYYGRPILMRAILNHSDSMLKVLLLCGADPNKKDRHNLSPLYYACLLKKKKMVKTLLEAGAQYEPAIIGKTFKKNHQSEMIQYIHSFMHKNSIFAAANGEIHVEYTKPIDFTSHYPYSSCAKITPLRAALFSQNLSSMDNIFAQLVDELTKNPSNKKAAISLVVILKSPQVRSNPQALPLFSSFGKNLLFDQYGNYRQSIAGNIERLLH